MGLDERQLAEALADLTATTPPQCFWAGYDTARLVAITHWREWQCCAFSIRLDDAGRVMEGGGDEIVCTPRKWVDIWGRRIDDVWKQSVECAKGWLMSRPGMNEVSHNSGF